jgi:hypothetical protein
MIQPRQMGLPLLWQIRTNDSEWLIVKAAIEKKTSWL